MRRQEEQRSATAATAQTQILNQPNEQVGGNSDSVTYRPKTNNANRTKRSGDYPAPSQSPYLAHSQLGGAQPPIYDADSIVRNVCAAIDGRMVGGICRAPAPGKSRHNDSLIVMPSPDLSGGIAVYMHNDPENLGLCLALKDDWRDRGLIPDTRKRRGLGRQSLTPLIRHDTAAQMRRETERAQRSKDKAKAIWQATAPANQTLANDYLTRARGIRLATMPDAIRFHVEHEYWHDGVCLFRSPAMVAKIVNCVSGEAQGVHITWLDEAGNKHPAAIGGARKFRGISKAGCVRLGNPHKVHAVAEGIESALAFTQLYGVSCDAALSADGVANYTPPPECEGLLICYDNDANCVGQRAGQTLANRMKAKGLECAFKPSPQGSDWNDYLQGAQS